MVYKTIFKSLADMVNKAQYFNPIFSWLVVFFSYYSIGNQGGVIWKYLLYATSLGLIATCFNMAYIISENLNYYYYDKFLLLIWIEGICWTFNEWIYIYISYIKIKSCIKVLKKKFWKIILYIILIYTLIVRFVLVYLDYTQNLKKMKYPEDKYITKDPVFKNRKEFAYGLLYFPLGLICISFVFFIIKEIIEENDESNRNVILILLQSTLSRMGFVSLLFIGLSIVIHLPSDGIFGIVRDLLWRLKDNLGIIFLIDILLIRIDLEKNRINLKEQEIEKLKMESSLKSVFPPNEDIYSELGIYNCGSTVVDNDCNNEYMYIKNYDFPHKNEEDYYDEDDDSVVHSYQPANRNSQLRNLYISQDRKSAISAYSTRSAEIPVPSSAKTRNVRKYSMYTNIDTATISNAQNADNRYSCNSVVLGKKVYSKVPLSPTLSAGSRTVVSSTYSYSIPKMTPLSPVSSTVAGNEFNIHPIKNAKKSPSNILIESNLL